MGAALHLIDGGSPADCKLGFGPAAGEKVTARGGLVPEPVSAVGAVLQPFGSARGAGALARFFDPQRFAIDSDDLRGGRQNVEQHAAPMSDAAAHVEHGADFVESRQCRAMKAMKSAFHQ